MTTGADGDKNGSSPQFGRQAGGARERHATSASAINFQSPANKTWRQEEMQKIPKGKRNVSHMEDSRCAVRLVNAFSPSVLAGIGNWQRRDAENRKNVVNNVRAIQAN